MKTRWYPNLQGIWFFEVAYKSIGKLTELQTEYTAKGKKAWLGIKGDLWILTVEMGKAI